MNYIIMICCRRGGREKGWAKMVEIQLHCKAAGINAHIRGYFENLTVD
jgi:hypothetical protein